MRADERGFRVALCADALVNPTPGAVDVLPLLEQARFGVIQLPSADLAAPVVEAWLEQVSEHAETFARGGYALALLTVAGEDDGGAHRDALERALDAFGQPLPPEHAVAPGGEADLTAFLAGLQPPAEP